MRVVVTRIGPDGTMRRRVVDTAASSDAGPWEKLIARALAAPPPYRPVPGVRFTIFAPVSGSSWSPDTTCPGRCTTWSPPCLPSARRHIEPVTSQRPGRSRPASPGTGRTPGCACRKDRRSGATIGAGCAAAEPRSEWGFCVPPSGVGRAHVLRPSWRILPTLSSTPNARQLRAVGGQGDDLHREVPGRNRGTARPGGVPPRRTRPWLPRPAHPGWRD
jgi:hypothetical protein